jgi:hypothetical protein
MEAQAFSGRGRQPALPELIIFASTANSHEKRMIETVADLNARSREAADSAMDHVGCAAAGKQAQFSLGIPTKSTKRYEIPGGQKFVGEGEAVVVCS